MSRTVISRLIRKNNFLFHVPDLNLWSFAELELIQLKNRVLAEQKVERNMNKNTGNIFR